ncbi:hypothetical protein KHA96_20115 [Bacillus sp. FJAT-49711]|uniref:hypothetical protein n=1 Tax=Bacillus sp. FJAT-49711 TaxID=2833585 RepID=UPI001BC982CF|nr:hypothetical protein [Bacillus sp. FJAT-49711]MBS4220605.1 hypothetical protein [Bacillus sp. FJAT-49711]
MFSGMREETLRKIHNQENKITGDKNVPHNSVVVSAREELQGIYSGEGRIYPKYAKEVVIALEYARNHHHFETGYSMLEDIENGKRIDFNDYKK